MTTAWEQSESVGKRGNEKKRRKREKRGGTQRCVLLHIGGVIVVVVGAEEEEEEGRGLPELQTVSPFTAAISDGCSRLCLYVSPFPSIS